MQSNTLDRCACLVALMATGNLLAADPQGPPDLTKDRNVDRSQTYNLGATGLRGWIYLKPATHFDGLQGRALMNAIKKDPQAFWGSQQGTSGAPASALGRMMHAARQQKG